MGAFEALSISSHRLCRWYLTCSVFVAPVVNVYVRKAMARLLVHLEFEVSSLEKKKANRAGLTRMGWYCEQVNLS